jgi:hypothetical protein
LVVLAGLPPALHNWATDFLKSEQRLVVGAPSAPKDGRLYPSRVIDTLLEAASRFAIRRRLRAPTDSYHPRFITLLYVPSPDKEALLSAFDFAVLPVPLSALAAYGETGRMHRHDRATVAAALRDAFAPRANASAGEVRQRVERRSEADALLLPPMNFLIGAGDLTVMFREYRSGERELTNRFPELTPIELNSDDLPKKLRKGEVRRVHVDERDLAFLQADSTEFHGPPRELPEDADAVRHILLLRSLYRFGGALPPGFHHDVQRRDGTEMRATPFRCCVAGAITVSATYANVYPNDYVRAKGMAEAKP